MVREWERVVRAAEGRGDLYRGWCRAKMREDSHLLYIALRRRTTKKREQDTAVIY